MRRCAFCHLMLASVSSSEYKMDAKMDLIPHGVDIPQGTIEMDSEFAKKIHFISKRFFDCSSMRGEGNQIIIQTIECKDRRRGYLRDLFKAIWDMGAEIAVYTPLSTMEQILIHYGFRKTIVKSKAYDKTDLWVK